MEQSPGPLSVPHWKVLLGVPPWQGKRVTESSLTTLLHREGQDGEVHVRSVQPPRESKPFV